MQKRTLRKFNCCAFGMLAFVVLFLGGGSGGTAHGQELWELMPYRVRIMLHFAAEPELSEHWQREVDDHLRTRTAAAAGSLWELEISRLAEGSLGRADDPRFPIPPALPSTSDADGTAAEATGKATDKTVNQATDKLIDKLDTTIDKLIVIAVVPDEAGWRVAAAEYDTAARAWGLPHRRLVGRVREIPEAVGSLAIEVFGPVARIERAERHVARVRVRGSALPRGDEGWKLVKPGDLFRPFIYLAGRQNRAARARLIEWTWLVAGESDAAGVNCQVQSGLAQPLASKRRGRTEQLAVMVPPAPGRTRLVLEARDSHKPLAGREVVAVAGARGTSKNEVNLGRTGADGSVAIEATGLQLLQVRSGPDVLARLPMVAGLVPEMKAPVRDDEPRVIADGLVIGFQEQVIDAVARRAVLSARIRSQVADGNKELASKSYEALQKLPRRSDFQKQLRTWQTEFQSRDARVQQKIDTLFRDTYALLDRCFDAKQTDAMNEELEALVQGSMGSSVVKPYAAEPGAEPPGGTSVPVDSDPSDDSFFGSGKPNEAKSRDTNKAEPKSSD